MSSEEFSVANVRRALVIKLRHHGDVLLATPVLSMLQRVAPQCEIDALVYSDTVPMLAGNPHLAQLHVIDRNWKKQGVLRQAAAEWRLLSQLRARHYDLVIHLSVHKRGAWLTRLLRPRWSVAPRIHAADSIGASFWANSFTHFYAAQSHPDRHTVESNLDSLRALGLSPLPADKRVVLVPGAAAEAHVDALLASHGIRAGGFIHIHPASRWLFKCWPADRVATLCRLLADQGWPIVLTCAPDAQEMALLKTIFAELGKLDSPSTSSTGKLCVAVSLNLTTGNAEPSLDTGTALVTRRIIDFSGQLTLKELAALSARARLFVGVDSAPMHIAAAMGTPTVAIFGPSGDREWGPWNVAHRVVASTTHACRPCGRAGCNDSKISECLTTLPVAQVYAACAELL